MIIYKFYTFPFFTELNMYIFDTNKKIMFKLLSAFVVSYIFYLKSSNRKVLTSQSGKNHTH